MATLETVGESRHVATELVEDVKDIRHNSTERAQAISTCAIAAAIIYLGDALMYCLAEIQDKLNG